MQSIRSVVRAPTAQPDLLARPEQVPLVPRDRPDPLDHRKARQGRRDQRDRLVALQDRLGLLVLLDRRGLALGRLAPQVRQVQTPQFPVLLDLRVPTALTALPARLVPLGRALVAEVGRWAR